MKQTLCTLLTLGALLPKYAEKAMFDPAITYDYTVYFGSTQTPSREFV